MKKSISTVLSLALVCSVMVLPTTVKADTRVEINATEATTIEFEKYAEDIAKLIDSSATVTEGTSGVYNKVTGNNKFSNNGATYIKNATLPSGKTSVSLEIPVSVSKAGYYNVEFCVGGSSTTQNSSKIDFEIDGGDYSGKIIGDRHVPSSPDENYTNKVTPISGTNIYTHKGNATYLEEGTYVLKMNIYGTINSDTTINLIADYIKLTPFEPEAVGVTTKYFEFEDYDNMLISDNNTAHGKKMLYKTWIYGTGKTFDICIPMNIEESGDYNWEAVMTKSGGRNTSTMTLYVDGKEVAKNTSSGENISDTDGDGVVDYMHSSFQMHRYNSKETIHLEKGYREITLSVSKTSDNLYKFGADYFAIEKYVESLTAAAKENTEGNGFDITFSYPVAEDTLTEDNVIIKDADDISVDYSGALSEDGMTYTINPNGGLTSDMYSVIVKKEVAGVPGNTMDEDVIVPLVTGSESYAGAVLEYDLYMGGDAPFDSSASYKCGVVGSGNLITTAQSSVTIGTTHAPIQPAEGWYHIKAHISYPKQRATVTVTMPDGSTLTRGSYTYIHFTNATAFTDIMINADSDYIKNITLSADNGSAISRTAQSQKTYEGIFNIVTTFYGDEKTTRGFAWSGAEEHTDMVIRYAKADAQWDASNYIEKKAAYEQYDGQLYYKVDISGLEAGTEYVYMVGDTVDNVWTDKYEIETEKGNNHEFSFIALTDPQGSAEKDYKDFTKTLQAAMEDAPDAKFMVDLGDLVSTGCNEDQWKMYFNASQNYTATLPHMAVMGNHETRDYNDDPDVAGKHFGLHFNNPKNGGKAAIGDLQPDSSMLADTQGVIKHIEETIYSFDYGDAHFVAINTGSDRRSSTETMKLLEAQKDWIKQDIENSDKKWTIVLSHQGLYPAKTERYFGAREILEDLFVECGVDLVLQGHDHMVSRTYPMKSGTIQTRENTDVIIEDSGVVYFIPGAAANKRYDDITTSPSYMSNIVNTVTSQPTYAVLNVTEDKIEVVTKQINGEVLDIFSIVEKPEITLSQDTAQKTVTAKAEYTKAVSGTAIVGFYQGGRMVKAAIKGQVTDAHSVEITAENIQEGDFDEVKIFIWNIETLEPYIAAKSLRLR